MRQIGSLPSSANPQVFGDHLLALGISSRVVEASEGWEIWVHNEDLVDKAREELEAFRTDPGGERFVASRESAKNARLEAERLDREYRKNVRSVASGWSGINARRRPLTVALIVICVVVFFATESSIPTGNKIWDKLGFFSIQLYREPVQAALGLQDIHRGEVWRLITPIFLHVNLMHLIFNVWAILVEGTLIESRRGTMTLFVLTLLSAIASNVGQYVYVIQFYPIFVPWGGISGVGYALFGYLWMKGQYEPEQGMILHPSTVRLMILWLLFGFTGLMPMANGAHLVGLIIGVLFGLARF